MEETPQIETRPLLRALNNGLLSRRTSEALTESIRFLNEVLQKPAPGIVINLEEGPVTLQAPTTMMALRCHEQATWLQSCITSGVVSDPLRAIREAMHLGATLRELVIWFEGSDRSDALWQEWRSRGGKARAVLSDSEWTLVAIERDRRARLPGGTKSSASVQIGIELFRGEFEGVPRSVEIQTETIRTKTVGS